MHQIYTLEFFTNNKMENKITTMERGMQRQGYSEGTKRLVFILTITDKQQIITTQEPAFYGYPGWQFLPPPFFFQKRLLKLNFNH